MDTIADLPNQRAWRVQVSASTDSRRQSYSTRVQLVESLEGMTKNFANPYIVFYPAGEYGNRRVGETPAKIRASSLKDWCSVPHQ